MTIVRFTGLPAGALDTVTIVDAYIKLRSVYHFGDAIAPIAFLGYQVIANSDSAIYDSLTTRPRDYYSSNSMLAYPPTIVDDTSSIQCMIIDTSVVHSWFTTAGSASNYGIILIPTNVSIVKGFASFANATSAYWPTLVIDYLNVSKGTSGSVSYSSGVSHYVANIDQITLVSSDPQSMFVQSGVAYRAQLDFNLRSLPKAGLILKADLELTFNPTQSNLNSFAADTLYSYFVNKDSTITQSAFQGQTITVGANKIYRFAIGDFVRSWANGDTLQRLRFGGLRESSSLDLFALYGTLSSADVKPRLIYTFIVQ